MSIPGPALQVLAPLSGVLVPLDGVPDPVFSGRIVGDGVSIDPTSAQVLAPVNGVVTQMHRAAHALTITTSEGIEVMIHVGVDTVGLAGRGFTARVDAGQSVHSGQPLIAFDPDWLARNARSLLTQVLVLNRERIGPLNIAGGLAQAGQTVILGASILAAPAPRADLQSSELISHVIALPNAQGLHARPAAILAAAAKRFQAQIRLVRGTQSANAKSVVALMALATRAGEEVQLRACGPDAAVAIESLTQLLAAGSGESPGSIAAADPVPSKVSTAARGDERILVGLPAAPGVALGCVHQLRRHTEEFPREGRGPELENAALEAALAQSRMAIQAQAQRMADRAQARIFDAHVELLSDPELIEAARAQLQAGKSAGCAWQLAYQEQADRLAALDNHLLRERASDILDVGRRVLALLAGTAPIATRFAPGTVLVAEELTPSETAALDPHCVLAICTTGGGPTGHVAILARSLGIAAICGIDPVALALAEGAQVIVDADAGTLRSAPTAQELSQARARTQERTRQRAEERAAAQMRVRTADGYQVEVVANVRNAQEASAAVTLGAEGVGLLRSEFLFADRVAAPPEAEQARAYLAVAQALGPERILVIRTLDAGGDKPLSYLPMPHEDNPFLGVRGIRLSLVHEDLFRAQLRAISRVGSASPVHILFPMVSSIEELRAARRILEQEWPVGQDRARVGVMIEVPAAAILADVLAPEVDFFSIGTNDLTQYTLAIDRGHPQLARQADSLHPAVLRLIQMTVQAAHRHGKWVGVCGGIAGETGALAALVGLDVDELSVPVPMVPEIKAAVARLHRGQCRDLAQRLLKMETAIQVRAFLQAQGAARPEVNGGGRKC